MMKQFVFRRVHFCIFFLGTMASISMLFPISASAFVVSPLPVPHVTISGSALASSMASPSHHHGPQFGVFAIPDKEDQVISSTPLSSMPELGADGVYHIKNGNQHKEFLQANTDKLVVIRFIAPWCKMCKQMQPKFMALVQANNNNNDIVWADYTVRNSSREYAISLGIEKVPTISVHIPGGLVDIFDGQADKMHLLKQKLRLFSNHGESSYYYTTDHQP